MKRPAIIAFLTITSVQHLWGQSSNERFADVKAYGAKGDGSDATLAFQTAIASGMHVYVPPGNYGITKTLIPGAGQWIIGAGQRSTFLWKYADLPIFALENMYAGVRALTLHGAFSISASNYAKYLGGIPSPTGRPPFTDTTDMIQIGATHVGRSSLPFGVVLEDIEIILPGRDGVNWLEGNRPRMKNLSIYSTGRSGLWINQVITGGGTALDTSEADIGTINIVNACLSVAFPRCEGARIAGANLSIAFIKSYASLATGILVESIMSRLRVFVEQSGQANGQVPTWLSATKYGANSFVRHANRMYVTVAGGTSGSNAPTCISGSCSDGSVIWIYRSNNESGLVINTSKPGGFGRCTPGSGIYCFNNNVVDVEFLESGNGYSISGDGLNEIRGLINNLPSGGAGNQSINSINAAIFPQHIINDVIFGVESHLNAFSTNGENVMGFAGFQAGMVNGAHRLNWFGVHNPSGIPEAFVGTPNDVPYGFYRNGRRRMLLDSVGVTVSTPLTIGSGITPSGTGFQHIRIPSCETAAFRGSTCTTAVNWKTPFRDAAYTPVCTIQATAGAPTVTSIANTKTQAEIRVTITSLTPVSSSGVLNCIAVHD